MAVIIPPQCLTDVVRITRSANSDKNELYALGYMMQEVAEFVQAVDALTNPDSRYSIEHDQHVFDEAADAIQTAISHMSMVSQAQPETLIVSILTNIQNIDSNGPEVSYVVSTSSLSAALSELIISIGNFAEDGMIEQGLILHKLDNYTTPELHVASVVNNVFSIVKMCYPQLSNLDIQNTIFHWIEKKNHKWLSVVNEVEK